MSDSKSSLAAENLVLRRENSALKAELRSELERSSFVAKWATCSTVAAVVFLLVAAACSLYVDECRRKMAASGLNPPTVRLERMWTK